MSLNDRGNVPYESSLMSQSYDIVSVVLKKMTKVQEANTFIGKNLNGNNKPKI